MLVSVILVHIPGGVIVDQEEEEEEEEEEKERKKSDMHQPLSLTRREKVLYSCIWTLAN
jgi:hypothetical protein